MNVMHNQVFNFTTKVTDYLKKELTSFVKISQHTYLFFEYVAVVVLYKFSKNVKTKLLEIIILTFLLKIWFLFLVQSTHFSKVPKSYKRDSLVKTVWICWFKRRVDKCNKGICEFDCYLSKCKRTWLPDWKWQPETFYGFKVMLNL